MVTCFFSFPCATTNAPTGFDFSAMASDGYSDAIIDVVPEASLVTNTVPVKVNMMSARLYREMGLIFHRIFTLDPCLLARSIFHPVSD